MSLDFLSGYSVVFAEPWYLLLLLVIPVLWAFSFRGLAGLGGGRRLVVMLLRTLVCAILVLAIAGVQWKRTSDRLTVIYLLDQSESIPRDQKRRMIEYVNAAIERHREGKDRVGVVVFGRDSAMEIPPFDEDIIIPVNRETDLDPEFTNLEGAMKLAEASFPHDSAKRVVVISDGNQNMGNALAQGRSLTEKGISIHVKPIYYPNSGEVLVDKLILPPNVRKGQPFDLRAVITNNNPHEVTGRLRFERRTKDQPVVINQPVEGQPDPQRVTLRPGKNVFGIRLEIDKPHFYQYSATFIPDDKKKDDGMTKNNTAGTFTHVRGSGQVLLIDDHESPGEFGDLVEALRLKNLEVTVQPSDQLFSSLAELQQFDTVLLANVPREHFTDSQIQMLVANTQHLAGGLVMLGGRNSFGAGGWTNTELEKAMPLDFQIKNAKVMPKGALVLVMHASETSRGNYWMKIVAREAIKALGNQDYCGLAHWNGTPQWLWNNPQGLAPVGRNRGQMIARLNRMAPGDMPEFAPTMIMALKAFNGLKDTAIKHIVIISDGDPSPPKGTLVNQFVKGKITISTVEVSSHGAQAARTMQRLATATGGKYYKVLNNRSLPRIFQKEARRVARPLIFETPDSEMEPEVVRDHPMLSGVGDVKETLPPITGYVMTTVKTNDKMVEVLIEAPQPAERTNNALLATRKYGLGKTVCFTTDAGGGKTAWAAKWKSWEDYGKLFSQMVQWSMRDSADDGNYTVVTKVENDKVVVIVDALNKENEFENMLNVVGTAMGPDADPAKAIKFALKQTAPGHYVGEFPATDTGSYMVMLSPGPGKTPLRAGVNVPYSAEFRSRGTNRPLLEQIAKLSPKGGKPGLIIDVDTQAPITPQQEVLQLVTGFNSFEHDLEKATSSQDAWHYLVLAAACLFFFDVFFRRVQVGWSWLPKLLARLRRGEEEEESEYMARLRSRKQQVTGEIETRKAAARFEADEEAEMDEELIASTGGEDAGKKPSGKSVSMSDEEEEDEDSYTNRLLEAKKKARKDRKE